MADPGFTPKNLDLVKPGSPSGDYMVQVGFNPFYFFFF